MKINADDILQNLRNFSNIKLNKRAITFIICILISTFFWFLIVFSKKYNATVSFPVRYVNLPANKVLANVLTENIDVQIYASGFSIIGYKLNPEIEPLTIDVNDIKPYKKEDFYYLTTNSEIDKFETALNSEIQITKVIPDTIYFDFSPVETKTIPVKLVTDLKFESQYQLADSIKVTPKEISVSGARSALQNISSIETEKISLKDINKTTQLDVPLVVNSSMEKLTLSATKVAVTIPVARYTEASFVIPVQVINLPANVNMKIFPDKINVNCLVSFADYQNLNSSQFVAVVDYQEINAGDNKLNIILKKVPDKIKSLQIQPDKVEYIISK